MNALRPRAKDVPTSLSSKYVLTSYYVAPTLSTSHVRLVVVLTERLSSTFSQSPSSTSTQSSKDAVRLSLAGFVVSSGYGGRWGGGATESVSTTMYIPEKGISPIATRRRRYQLSTLVDMSGISFGDGDATVFGVLSSTSSSTSSSLLATNDDLCLGGIPVSSSILLSPLSLRSNYNNNNNISSNNGSGRGNIIATEQLDHVPSLTLLVSADSGSSSRPLPTQRLRERVHTALVASGNINPESVTLTEHVRGCSVCVPLSSGGSSGGGTLAAAAVAGGALRQVVSCVPTGVTVVVSKCTATHVSSLELCVDACLSEVRGRFVTTNSVQKSNSSGSSDSSSADVAITNVSSLFS